MLSENPVLFSELPASLVDEMLKKSENLGQILFESFNGITERKMEYRKALENDNILQIFDDKSNIKVSTICGIDGSYAIEKLLGTDLITCASVGVEGFVPPSEIKLWDKLNYDVIINAEPHNPDNSTILRGLMVEMEIILASKAPHQLILLDGSFTSPLIQMNQAVNKAIKIHNSSSKILIDKFKEFLLSYNKILNSSSEKSWISLPKYTSKKELGKRYNWPSEYDDRAILTTILNPNEFTDPSKIIMSYGTDDYDEEAWHLKSPYTDNELDVIIKKIIENLKTIHIMYFKPNEGFPALRIELGDGIAHNTSKLLTILKTLKYQCDISSIIEPYPLFMADRIVKHIPRALPTLRQTATQKMAELEEGNITDKLFYMHSYRTEGGVGL